METPITPQDILTAQQQHAASSVAYHSELWKFMMDNLSQWTAVLFVMLIELGLLLLIVSPIPIKLRRNVLQLLSKAWNEYPRFRIIYKTFIGICSAFFLDNLRQMYMVHLQTVQPNLTLTGKDKELELALTISQRNAFLTGFTVLLFLILYRFQSMTDTIVELEAKLRLSDPNLVKTSESTIKKDYEIPKKKEPVNDLTKDDITVRQRTTVTPAVVDTR